MPGGNECALLSLDETCASQRTPMSSSDRLCISFVQRRRPLFVDDGELVQGGWLAKGVNSRIFI
jgi:hypothetical protein